MTDISFSNIDVDNTEIAYALLDDIALKKSAWIFSIMRQKHLVSVGSQATLLALKAHLPVEGLIKKTIFEQFCGGTTLLNAQKSIEGLGHFGVASILDYGAEGKEAEEDFDKSMNQTIRAIDFGSATRHVPIVSLKVTAMGRFELLEKIAARKPLTDKEKREYEVVLKRLDSICHRAREQQMGVFIDAEESWVQGAIDDLANMMMERYNRDKCFIYNTFQMYRHDRLAYLKKSYAAAEKRGYILGAKIVRGAYMDKERDRAIKMGYPSPIQPTKEATDRDFDDALAFCVKNYQKIAVCAATHNAKSSILMANLIQKMEIERKHPHFLFSQLYGMSDNLTFNIANAGYNAAKYMVYGPVREVVPYLIRRAQENASVTGEVGRELNLLQKEIKRRNL